MAVISSAGGAITQLNLNGEEVICPDPNPADWKKAYGSILAPWPNRLDNGIYKFGGRIFHARDLDEDSNANHGYLLSRNLDIVNEEKSELVLAYQFGEDDSYPFQVRLEVRYSLSDSELSISAVATNLDSGPAPFAIGFHPYFCINGDFRLSANVQERYITDERMLPVSKEPFSGLEILHTGESQLAIDSCFSGSDLVVSLDTQNYVLEIQQSSSLDHLMIYKPNEANLNLLAIEPMSAPANAFATEISRHTIPSGEFRSFTFGIKMRKK